MLKILKGTDKDILENLEILAKDYLEKTGRKVCRTCPSDIAYMVLSLKNFYKMTNFKFKRNAAHYKNKKGDRKTISNSTMTDEGAIEFLRTNPKRIDLFSEFPENWKKLVAGKVETPEEIEARLAIEAEIATAKKAKEAKKNEGVIGINDGKEKKALMAMPLRDLRAKYPNIKATSIKGFVEKVLNS